MKRNSRFLGVFLCLFLSVFATVCSTNAYAAETDVINTETTSLGYFTVHYTGNTDKRMKVGVSHEGSTVYYDYVPGAEASYTFTKGDGNYTITLYSNVSGSSYKKVTSEKAVVAMEDEFAPYLASTEEIKFSADDEIGMKAKELCAGLTDDASKVVAIHNYIAANFTYDREFAANVTSGKVKSYVPSTSDILASGKGVCYDFSALFSAMCRSEGIPCAIEKGMRFGGYHAWNSVYVNDSWQSVDMTVSVANHTSAKTLADCLY